MYFLSLSIKDELPQELHNAMLLWSFSPQQADLVKSYLHWVETCKERKQKKNEYLNRKKNQEIFLISCMTFCFICLAFIIL